MKLEVMGLEKSDEKRKVSQLSNMAMYCTTLRPSRCRLPHKQEMERQHNKSNVGELQSSSTSHTHNIQFNPLYSGIFYPYTYSVITQLCNKKLNKLECMYNSICLPCWSNGDVYK